MIVGLTHNAETKEQNKIVKYKGKISTGWAPGEGPGKFNYPRSSGFFRMLKEVNETIRVGVKQEKKTQRKWVTNEPVQAALEATCNGSKEPRRLEIVSMYSGITEIWESSLAWFSGGDGLVCQSQGRGTTAKMLEIQGGERRWIDRPCMFQDCPQYIEKKCCVLGRLKCFPSVDFAINPYRFETKSINSIIGIESNLVDLFRLTKAAHIARQYEAGKLLPFDGLFGAKLMLVLRKMKSGGKEIYCTDLMPSPEFNEMIMEPVKRGLATKAKMSRMIGEAGSMSLLENAQANILENIKTIEGSSAEVLPLELDENPNIDPAFKGQINDEEIATVAETSAEEVGENVQKVSDDMVAKATETMLDPNASPQ